jgi:DNA polymerase III epsilon subunit-like protein
MAKSLIHLNGNLLVAVDVETTGLIPRLHEIWQVAVLPLDSTIKPLKGVIPFNLILKPNRPEDADPDSIPRKKLVDACLTGIDQDIAADMLYTWFEKLKLAFEKRLCPLACNWVYDRSFLMEWLGHTQFSAIFHPWYRDVMCAAQYANDRADHHVEQVPYPKASLKYLCSTLKVVNESPHDALSDCVATAEVYRTMLGQLF